CGRRVVEEPDHDNAPPPFTHQQIEAEQAAHARALGRIGWVMATTFLAWFAVIVVIALYRDTIREAVRPFIDPQWIAVLIPLPLVAAGVAAALILIRADRIAPTRCPFCTTRLHRLYGTLVWISGNCWGCGRHVVIPASVEEAAGPLPSVEAFKESFARVRRAG